MSFGKTPSLEEAIKTALNEQIPENAKIEEKRELMNQLVADTFLQLNPQKPTLPGDYSK